MVGYISRWFICLQTVTHPSSNRGQCTTPLIGHKVLLTTTVSQCYECSLISVIKLHCVSKNGPLIHLQITPTILVQYQQIFGKKNCHTVSTCYFAKNIKNRVPAEVFLWHYGRGVCMVNLRIHYLGFSGIHWQKSGLFHDFFSTYVQFQDFSGPEK